MTDAYNNNNCTNNDNNIEIILPLITIVPCGMSLVCLISLMVYNLIKPLIRKKIFFNKRQWRKKYIHLIQFVVL